MRGKSDCRRNLKVVVDTGRFFNLPRLLRHARSSLGSTHMRPFLVKTRTTFVQHFIRFIGADTRQGLIALGSIGVLTPIGYIRPFKLLEEFGGNQ